jgi:hypothetical protein
MKTFSKTGLLALAALAATAAMASSAHAQSFSPDNTPISGVSSNMNLAYGASSFSCDSATFDATTGLDSPVLNDVALGFGDCSVAGGGTATMDCVGDLLVRAESAVDDTATAEPNDGFQCDIATALCTVTIAGPQTSQPGNTALDEANDVLSAFWEFQASRTGSPLCGPASGTATWTADYDTLPTDFAIDP